MQMRGFTGAGACPVAAAMFGSAPAHCNKIVCVVSGGGLDSSKLVQLLEDRTALAATTTPAKAILVHSGCM